MAGGCCPGQHRARECRKIVHPNTSKPVRTAPHIHLRTAHVLCSADLSNKYLLSPALGRQVEGASHLTCSELCPERLTPTHQTSEASFPISVNSKSSFPGQNLGTLLDSSLSLSLALSYFISGNTPWQSFLKSIQNPTASCHRPKPRPPPPKPRPPPPKPRTSPPKPRPITSQATPHNRLSHAPSPPRVPASASRLVWRCGPCPCGRFAHQRAAFQGGQTGPSSAPNPAGLPWSRRREARVLTGAHEALPHLPLPAPSLRRLLHAGLLAFPGTE